MTTGGTRARWSLLAVIVVLGVLTGLGAGASVAGAEEHCTDDPLGIGCEPTENPTTTTVEETTTTEEATTTTAAAVVTTTTRPAPRPTTTSIVEVEITTTTLGVTTSTNLLVPGDGTEGAESTTTTEVVAVAVVSDGGPSDGTLIGIVVAGLVLIALVVAVLTWRYWAATRPLHTDGDGQPLPAG